MDSRTPIEQPQAAEAATQPPVAAGENPDKDYVITFLFSLLLGSLGIDRFYLNKIGTGIAKLLTLGGLGIWQLVDLILLVFNKLHAKGDDRPLKGYAQNEKWAKIATIVLIVFNVLVVFGFIILMIILAAAETSTAP